MATTSQRSTSPSYDLASTSLQTSLPSEDYIPRAMPARLGALDMTAAYVIALFLMPSAVLTALSGVNGIAYLVLGAIVFLVPCAIATAQLGVMFPHEGSLYNWTHKALGGYWSFFIGACFWLTGVIAAVSALNAIASLIQGLNPAWLTQMWQQGVVMLLILGLVCVILWQGSRLVHNLVNAACICILAAVLLTGIAALVWLATGHASVTSFTHLANWTPTLSTCPLFGLITLNYIGTSGPLNLAGEIAPGRQRYVVTRHLLWGTPLVFLCYILSTVAILVVRGQAAVASSPAIPFGAITAIDVTLGRDMGDLAVVLILAELIITTLFYTHISARLLLVAGIDRRIPAKMGRLNKHRSPHNAVFFQVAAVAVAVIVIFILVPYVARFGAPANLVTRFFNVNLASLTIIWTIATAFFFINIAILSRRDPIGFRRARIFPLWLLWGSAAVGFAACLVTILDTMLNSWTVLIPNTSWWYIVGGLTLFYLIACAIASMVANSQANWENFG
jgi:amino acid transporter